MKQRSEPIIGAIMTTQPALLTLPEAAATIGLELDVLTAALKDAVSLAETPTANNCTMPGAALQVRFELAGRLVGAIRESDHPSAQWTIALPSPSS